ncbi:M-phase phosphoprotein 6-like [Lytechinus pictus]|uniref:M-phase phosphoprotein 6-like n=1 Tax=Lytechinus pictus TaxID=7653 RepID=UPI0030B9FBC8
MAGTRGQSKNIRLSKNLSQMKFMQRRVKKDAEEEQELEKQRQIDDTHWVLDLPDLILRGNRYETVDSMADCEDLVFGRMSFNGMNPAIEKVMRVMNGEEVEDEEEVEEQAEGVTEEEMADRYSSLVGTIGKKFNKKRIHSQTDTDAPRKKHKKKFLKPPDE